MATQYKGVNVKCPYYLADSSQEIQCEGIFRNTVCKHRYKKAMDKASFFEKYCCSYAWTSCRMAALLNEKYK